MVHFVRDLVLALLAVGSPGFSPTRLAFGVLTYLTENRIVCLGGGGSPHAEPGSPDDPNLVPPN